ncbi:hypothetical protein SAMN04487936_101487 [Halobacillus dabanensis]|uniref:Uncharacterized protein n=1 Tax=Halobacillus dabanensis TaxID=240302 RepID=A0A1I3PYR0_HALDA|nr:hypothetical protein [Halobacillus dabanensis]SFJ26808.1 hypothetical protein SAMN04487936_101487 [Halobacillus dabanensis]
MKQILWIVVSLVVLVLGCILLFIFAMIPDNSEEEAEKMGTAYIDERFPDRAEVYGTLFDNMGNHEFEYAAEAGHENGVDFLIYEDSQQKVVKDNYATRYYEEQIEKELDSYISREITKVEAMDVFIINPLSQYQGEDDLPEFTEVAFDPLVDISLGRGAEEGDEDMLRSLLSFMKEEIGLDQGGARFVYEFTSGDEMLLVDY